MAEFDENNIQSTLDKLDYEATMVGGFTQKELLITFVVMFLISASVMTLIAHFWIGIWSLGLIAGGATAGLLTAKASHTAYHVKKGRPSYMLWVDLRRKVQDDGFLGIKIDFKCIRSTYWSINDREV
ncbi:DUF3487 family protein [Vibrio sp. THAF190c]|jgi:hypothetical protein|uniref:DUF3487 family protein n=1 Tax=Vibrio sp. THAF190c TaxID=2587865 RepID=UPI001267CE79|nr:DUF3487 family protein [Vibrio sp. THAF190c]QFT13406.1 hypothetical protein FIV04_25985 [Vibrio sp. THAF190c]